MWGVGGYCTILGHNPVPTKPSPIWRLASTLSYVYILCFSGNRGFDKDVVVDKMITIHMVKKQKSDLIL